MTQTPFEQSQKLNPVMMIAREYGKSDNDFSSLKDAFKAYLGVNSSGSSLGKVNDERNLDREINKFLSDAFQHWNEEGFSHHNVMTDPMAVAARNKSFEFQDRYPGLQSKNAHKSISSIGGVTEAASMIKAEMMDNKFEVKAFHSLDQMQKEMREGRKPQRPGAEVGYG